MYSRHTPGELDFDSILTPDEDIECAEKFISESFIGQCREGQSISHRQKYLFYPNRYVSCTQRKNLHTIRETVNHLAAVGCESVRFGTANEKGEWLKNKEDNTLSTQEYIEAALNYIPHYYEDGMPVNIIILCVFSASPGKPADYSVMPAKPESDNPERLLFACSRNKLQILPNGRISVCQNLNVVFPGYPPIVTDTLGQEIMSLCEILSTGSDYMNLHGREFCF